jgi:hypothetical protein
MKTPVHFLFGVAFIAMLSFAGNSCSKKDNPETIIKGKLKLSIGITIHELSASGKLKAGTDDFGVQIFNTGNEPVISFEHASDIPELVELPQGTYYAVASSGDSKLVTFDNPYYYGKSETFSITSGQTSSVTITCSLANIMVTVVYTDRVKNSYANFTSTVSNPSDSLVFIKSETRAGYFNTGPLHIKSYLYMAGSTIPAKTLHGDITSPQPGKHYEFRIDASPTAGSAMITITLNDTVNTEIVDVTENAPETGAPVYGDLLITEIMYNPLALSDTEGEWIELFNNSRKTINLKGLVIRRSSTSSFHQIKTDVNLAPGAYAVLGKTSSATSNVHYVYGSSITLTNTGDELVVNTYGTNGTDGTVICSVNYGATGFLTNLNGKSLQLDPTVNDANAAKLGTNWCAATLTYSTGDYGTPGLENSGCH